MKIIKLPATQKRPKRREEASKEKRYSVPALCLVLFAPVNSIKNCVQEKNLNFIIKFSFTIITYELFRIGIKKL